MVRTTIIALLCLGVVAGCGSTRKRGPPQLAGAAARGYDLQGHRGARGLRPENTLPAFEIALDYGVDTLELDLHWSADDQLIVWHDPVIDPAKCQVPNPAPPSLRIRDLDAKTLATFVCDKNPSAARFVNQKNDPGELAGSRYGIVTLQDVLDFVEFYAADTDKPGPRRSNAELVRFNIETKRDPKDPSAIGDGFDGTQPGPFERALVDEVRRRRLKHRVTIQSFDHRSLWAIRSIEPGVVLAALTETAPKSFDALEDASVWSPNYEVVTSRLVEQAHAAGLRVIPWTVNDPTVMADLLNLGVDGLITDRPDLAPASR